MFPLNDEFPVALYESKSITKWMKTTSSKWPEYKNSNEKKIPDTAVKQNW